MVARTYAQVVGVVLILVGVVGLLLGNGLFIGILNIDILEDLVHLITGGLLAHVGFARTDLGLTRTVVGVLGFVVPTIFGLIPGGYTVFDNLLHLALDVLGIAVAWFFARGSGESLKEAERR